MDRGNMKNRKDIKIYMDRAVFLMSARSNFTHTGKHGGPVRYVFPRSDYFKWPCLGGSECPSMLIMDLIMKYENLAILEITIKQCGTMNTKYIYVCINYIC